VRLLEPRSSAALEYQRAAADHAPLAGSWRRLPIHHIFGSEELSALAGGVAELAPAPYLALAPRDAEALGLREAEEATVELDDGARWKLPVRIEPDLTPGHAGLPVGLAGSPHLTGPVHVLVHNRRGP
jgi:NADH-quinone oxidoreductase subunit G